MAQHQFAKSYAQGKSGERFLDWYFNKFYVITQATRQQEREGFDRIFKSRHAKNGFEYIAKKPVEAMRVEYKTDYRAAETGNAFIETESVNTTGKRGWLYTSQAHLLVYFIPPLFRIYCCPMKNLAEAALVWQVKYAQSNADNITYLTRGLLIPIDEFAKVSVRTMQL